MTNAEARLNNSLGPRKPEGSSGRTATQDVHLDSHTAPELWGGPSADQWRMELCGGVQTLAKRTQDYLRWGAGFIMIMSRWQVKTFTVTWLKLTPGRSLTEWQSLSDAGHGPNQMAALPVVMWEGGKRALDQLSTRGYNLEFNAMGLQISGAEHSCICRSSAELPGRSVKAKTVWTR